MLFVNCLLARSQPSLKPPPLLPSKVKHSLYLLHDISTKPFVLFGNFGTLGGCSLEHGPARGCMARNFQLTLTLYLTTYSLSLNPHHVLLTKTRHGPAAQDGVWEAKRHKKFGKYESRPAATIVTQSIAREPIPGPMSQTPTHRTVQDSPKAGADLRLRRERAGLMSRISRGVGELSRRNSTTNRR